MFRPARPAHESGVYDAVIEWDGASETEVDREDTEDDDEVVVYQTRSKSKSKRSAHEPVIPRRAGRKRVEVASSDDE